MVGLLWALALVFVPLSLVTVGGGQAVVADIQRQIVDVHHWMTQGEFVNAFAISRMAPGPGSLLVTLVGWQVAGAWGAVVATIAIFGPTTFLIFGISHLWKRYRGALWQQALEAGLRPIAAGMILASVYVLMQALEGGWLAQGVALASTAALMLTRVNPMLLLTIGAMIFVGWGLV
ncbi:Chromate transport protein ChrA [Rhodovastum atsumiense]|uniref:Chromate transporter n=1 Tax=Rhodovastum atsumiense TaxID=504468 RepID=A0A5M6IQF0_9PROT|nr:chromate transporter [Rhodovastum atsumiense]KAA5610159.1 chromate transporter [Rhodovastum atsumiense]CAH2599252.1 Chromate transport protein ChrA [Rhodovastum atsumiense]